MASRATAAIAAALAAVLVAAGCGDDEAPTTTTSAPAATTAAPAATETAPPAEPAPDDLGTAEPEVEPLPEGEAEQQEGGAGDEAGAIVPARLRIDGARVRPATVSVPAFFAIRVIGVSADGRPHAVAFEGGAVDVPAGGRASFDVEGLRPGRYPVTVDGREGAATIVTGVEPGP